MANEIRGQLNFTVTNESFRDQVSEAFEINQAEVGFSPGTVLVQDSPTETDIDLSELTSEGFVFMKNLDATYNVTWGPKSGGVMVPLGCLKPGEIAFFRLEPLTVLRMTGDTDPCKVEVRVYEA